MTDKTAFSQAPAIPVEVEEDLHILEAMAVSMPDYLDSDLLFYPLAQSDLPRLTLGNYLFRQHRLLTIAKTLPASAQTRLQTTTTRFRDAVAEVVHRVEKHVADELPARERQWRAYLQDVEQEPQKFIPYYHAAVKTRAQLAALLAYVGQPPFQVITAVPEKLNELDARLHQQWHVGDFVWDAVWQPAYDRETYWWLYGRPTTNDEHKTEGD